MEGFNDFQGKTASKIEKREYIRISAGFCIEADLVKGGVEGSSIGQANWVEGQGKKRGGSFGRGKVVEMATETFPNGVGYFLQHSGRLNRYYDLQSVKRAREMAEEVRRHFATRL